MKLPIYCILTKSQNISMWIFLNEFLCLWLAQMRHEKGTCTVSILVRRAHVMVPVYGWRSVGILGHHCQSCQSVPSHLTAFKDCPAEPGRGYRGPHVFNSAQSGSPGGFTTQDRCQELPTREKGVGVGVRGNMDVEHTHTYIKWGLYQLHSHKVSMYEYARVWTLLCISVQAEAAGTNRGECI